MDEGERSFFEASQDGWDLRGEFAKKRTISWCKFRPSQKSGKVSSDLMGAHIAMARETS